MSDHAGGAGDVQPVPPAPAALELALFGRAGDASSPHTDRPGVAPPQDVLDCLAGVVPPPPIVYGFGVREPTFHAGVRPPSAAYGFGVRAPAFHAGVFPPSAYGFGVRALAFHAGVRPSVYGFGVRPDWPHPGVRPGFR